jgi:hypothetical protein
VAFWYDLCEVNDDKEHDDLDETLEDHAEERAKESIIQGCVSGDLNCLYVYPEARGQSCDDFPDGDLEIRGGWEINRG